MAELRGSLDFADLATLGDEIVRRLLRELRLTDLALALRTTPGVREVVFRNVSADTLRRLQNKMETQGAVRLYDVEMAQAGIMETLAALERSGEITIRKAL